MATRLPMHHPQTGILKDGFYGFSWTTLFFGFFPALFRSDFLTFIGGVLISVLVGVNSFGFGTLLINVVWAFMYNRYYTRKLLEQGYRFHADAGEAALASAALGVAQR